MKTLDEVIFETPYTMTPWEENAIYYLKEYHDYMKNEIIELQEEMKKQKEMIEFLEKPLTWDELKTMEGKPVWVVQFDNFSFSEWDLIHAVLEDQIWLSDGNGTTFFYNKITMGETWQAYRKERS